MGWTDKIKEGAKEFLNSDLGKEAAQIAREKAEKGLDSILGTGQTNRPTDDTEAPADQSTQSQPGEKP